MAENINIELQNEIHEDEITKQGIRIDSKVWFLTKSNQIKIKTKVEACCRVVTIIFKGDNHYIVRSIVVEDMTHDERAMIEKEVNDKIKSLLK